VPATATTVVVQPSRTTRSLRVPRRGTP
jgi:hypothetical protein